MRIRLQSCPPLPALKVWYPVQNDVQDIRNLKIALCAQLSLLKHRRLQPAQLVLDIEGFELFNECPVNVLREADIVMLKQQANRTPSSDATDSSVSSSLSDDTSSLSSVSNSPVLSTKHYGKAEVSKTAIKLFHGSINSSNQVPPGLGKPSTKARNRRRKIKRMLASGKSLSDITATATQARGAGDIINDITHEIPSNHSDGSKRGGSENFVEGVSPRKEGFGSTFSALSFIPPSERQYLPHNIFVTRVDLPWKLRKASTRFFEDPIDANAKASHMSEGEDETQGSLDWGSIEAEWNKYRKIDTVACVHPGAIVGWKGFGLDPMTLTPQASLLHLGKVIKLDVDNLTVLPLRRPGIGAITFGRASIETDEAEEPPEPISTLATEVCSGDWRLVTNG